MVCCWGVTTLCCTSSGLMISKDHILLSQVLMWESYFLGTLFHVHFLPLRCLQFTVEFFLNLSALFRCRHNCSRLCCDSSRLCWRKCVKAKQHRWVDSLSVHSWEYNDVKKTITPGTLCRWTSVVVFMYGHVLKNLKQLWLLSLDDWRQFARVSDAVKCPC